MTLSTRMKYFIRETICLLFVLLFIYASVSKLLDFQHFRIELGQSPLLSAFADQFSIIVPALEIIICVLLLIPKFKPAGLFAAYGLMVMFTAYIFIILNYTSFIPCSCGGVLEKMSWNVHFLFNIVFIFLAITAILLDAKFEKKSVGISSRKSLIWIFSITVSGIATVIFLFIFSEQIMHYENPFIRRYPRHAVMFHNELDLKFNSFYFAGTSGDRIYLGNSTSPLQLLSVDKNLRNRKVDRIIFNDQKILFHRPSIRIQNHYLFLIDGAVPAVLRGSLKDLEINKEFNRLPYFDQALPMDSSRIVLRSNKGNDLANILGVFDNDNGRVQYNSRLLQKQIDGVFDTDGRLLYDETDQRIVYVYFYRNQFITAGKHAELISRSRTIDTTSQAKLKVSYIKNSAERKMSAPPYIVNASAAVSGNLLFIHSKVRGKFQDEKTWNQAFIIDVYDINRQSYIMSFPIYKIKDEKLKNIIVTKDYLYAIIGNSLVQYELKASLKKEMRSAE
ncbi:DoxX family protein [uncultured Flavobacterium sp.]|uniref:MauE/DoxX family redox-associated membrane protein n=1 Tax=uncultured Flavobacterium sp. TaxID=165435 RepID=UPI0025F125DD|nr:DoxX family protein [uncultured Flavobacterium sp.]